MEIDGEFMIVIYILRVYGRYLGVIVGFMGVIEFGGGVLLFLRMLLKFCLNG